MRSKLGLAAGGALVLLLLSVMVSLSLGAAHVPFVRVWYILLDMIPGIRHSTTGYEAEYTIIKEVRLSRVVLAVLVGASLALAGAGFQGVLRNPLADPYTLGVATGASVGAAFLILFGLQGWIGEWTIPLVAFITGMLTLFGVLRLAYHDGRMELETLLLSGVVVQAFLGSTVSFMVSLSNNVVNEIVYWMMGSLSKRGWDYSFMLLPYVIVGLCVLIRYSRDLNLFALGERQAAHMGVHVQRTKMIVLIVSTLLTAAAVSVAGVVGFVGLVVPHLVRLVLGPDYRILIPVSALVGAIYVLWSDTLARLVLSPKEIPLGVITAFIGAPFFAYLLRKRKTGRG
ncbi:iron ABC transporter [Paenibacillus swuensis]|uniref:Iron ABC transporter n=1 Tax=Paenibacillus swuensis TaxID=1178515 RepID=A0A172TH34_9BACL|nr:iron ABC transporter permease [Paenibacillus swuensis]ANE46368.1 iron ABC transporter [Paenibacillus swuensis]